MQVETVNFVKIDSILGKKLPKVSVCVVTYNQEKYISQCLQSIFDQKTNFDFEIIVADDFSTDNTRNILQDFAKRYPDRFRLFLHEKNIGAGKNFRFIHEQPVGEYIVHMDGDDYALPGKLQMQADYLDVNNDCNIVFHRMIVTDVNDNVRKSTASSMENIMNYKFYRKDIIELVAIGAHSSKMYRASVRNKKLPNFDLVDYTVNVIQVDHGYAAYCSEKPLGVYRAGIGISGSAAVIQSVYDSLLYFKDKYPECLVEINAAAWSWLASNIKNGRPLKLNLFKFALTTFSLFGFVKFLTNRKARKVLGK